MSPAFEPHVFACCWIQITGREACSASTCWPNLAVRSQSSAARATGSSSTPPNRRPTIWPVSSRGSWRRVPASGSARIADADRLALIDETGRYVGEEYTLALCLQQVLRKRPGPVVTNCSTSRMSEDIAQRFKVPLFRSKVGEAHVADMMIARGAVFGGEGNGGPIDPRVGLVRDSFVGMAVVLEAMAERQMTLSALVAELPRYAIHKASVPVSRATIDEAMNTLATHFSDAQADRLDGLRLDWKDRWLLVRESNTEPIVRLVAEAPTAAEAAGLCDSAGSILVRQ